MNKIAGFVVFIIVTTFVIIGTSPSHAETYYYYDLPDNIELPELTLTAEQFHSILRDMLLPSWGSTQPDAYLDDLKFLEQPALGQIKAHHAYARGATGRGVRIAIEDDGVDLLNPEFQGRVNYDGALLTYWRPLAVSEGEDAPPHCQGSFTDAECHIFKIDAQGDEEIIRDYARYIIEAYGYPDEDDTWFIQDISQNDLLAWNEIPALYEPKHGHGTNVASVAAGWLFGVAPGAEIVPLAYNFDEQEETSIVWQPILDEIEQSRASPDPSYANEVDLELASWHKDHYANFDIINRSYGELSELQGEAHPYQFVEWVKHNLPRYWRAVTQQDLAPGQQKTIEIWSAGNESQWVPGPDSALPIWEESLRGHSFAVVATDLDGLIASYSNRCGPLPGDWDAAVHGRHYCLAAPGTLNAVQPDFDTDYPENSILRGIQGTSFAAPLVSGGIALVIEYFRGQLSNQEAALRVINTADNTGIYTDYFTYGAGMLDLEAATSPVGAVQTGTTHTQASIAHTYLQTPAAWGNVNRHLDGVEVAGFDAWNAPFWYSADSLVSSSRSYHALPVPNYEPTFEQTALLPHLHWFNVGGRRGGTGLLSEQDGMKLRMTALSGAADGLDDFSPDSSYHTFGFSGEIIAQTRMGFLMESHTNQGTRPAGAFGTTMDAQLVWVAREHTWPLHPEKRWTLHLAYLFAAGRPDYESRAMFAASGSLYSAASITVEQRSKQTRTRLSIGQPLRAESGRGTLRYATGRNRQGEWEYAETRFSLTPATREIQLQLRHDRLLGAGRIAIEAAYAHNAGHTVGNHQARFGLGYHIEW